MTRTSIRLTAAALLLATAVAAGIAKADVMKEGSGPLLTVKSARPVKETLDRLQQYVTEHGFVLVARVSHSDAAKTVGLELRPTELLVFGNPKGGTPIMQCNQRAGIDLPLKALAWQDASGQVLVGMNDPQAFKLRFQLGAECDGALAATSAMVKDFLGSVEK
ncbi:MAG: DUF302 domain-containing protein [Pseudolabrys sp.]